MYLCIEKIPNIFTIYALKIIKYVKYLLKKPPNTYVLKKKLNYTCIKISKCHQPQIHKLY